MNKHTSVQMCSENSISSFIASVKSEMQMKGKVTNDFNFSWNGDCSVVFAVRWFLVAYEATCLWF